VTGHDEHSLQLPQSFHAQGTGHLSRLQDWVSFNKGQPLPPFLAFCRTMRDLFWDPRSQDAEQWLHSLHSDIWNVTYTLGLHFIIVWKDCVGIKKFHLAKQDSLKCFLLCKALEVAEEVL